MTKICTLALCFALIACEKNPNYVEPKTVVLPEFIGQMNFQVVDIDGCEYLYYPGGNASMITHKGNCKYCKPQIGIEKSK